jgi:hypothetical protein
VVALGIFAHRVCPTFDHAFLGTAIDILLRPQPFANILIEVVEFTGAAGCAFGESPHMCHSPRWVLTDAFLSRETAFLHRRLNSRWILKSLPTDGSLSIDGDDT